jgi:hypothetical protein
VMLRVAIIIIIGQYHLSCSPASYHTSSSSSSSRRLLSSVSVERGCHHRHHQRSPSHLMVFALSTDRQFTVIPTLGTILVDRISLDGKRGERYKSTRGRYFWRESATLIRFPPLYQFDPPSIIHAILLINTKQGPISSLELLTCITTVSQ